MNDEKIRAATWRGRKTLMSAAELLCLSVPAVDSVSYLLGLLAVHAVGRWLLEIEPAGSDLRNCYLVEPGTPSLSVSTKRMRELFEHLSRCQLAEVERLAAGKDLDACYAGGATLLALQAMAQAFYVMPEQDEIARVEQDSRQLSLASEETHTEHVDLGVAGKVDVVVKNNTDETIVPRGTLQDGRVVVVADVVTELPAAPAPPNVPAGPSKKYRTRTKRDGSIVYFSQVQRAPDEKRTMLEASSEAELEAKIRAYKEGPPAPPPTNESGAADDKRPVRKFARDMWEIMPAETRAKIEAQFRVELEG